MKIGVSKKVILLFVLLLISLSGGLGGYFLKHEKRMLELEFDERAGVLLRSLAASSEYPVLIGNNEVLTRIGEGSLKQKDVVFCEITDKRGDVLFEGGKKNISNLKEYSIPILKKKIPVSDAEVLMLDFNEGETEEIGKIRLQFSLASVFKKFNEVRMAILIIVLIGVIASFFLVNLRISVVLSRPVNKLIKETEIISRGDLKRRVGVKSRDEIGLLARSFNHMLEQIQNRDMKLEKHREHLEDEVAKRTAELEMLNKQLKQEISERKRAEENLQKAYGKMEQKVEERTAEIIKTKEKLQKAYDEMEQRVEERTAEIIKANEELEAVNKELDSFTYTASHDLKEPLRAISTFSNFILDDYADRLDDQGKDYLKRISASVFRMQALIDDLLSLSRISRIRNPFESVDSGAIVAEAVRRLKPIIEEKKVKVEIDDELPFVYCDPVKMQEVIYNLVSNAIKYNDKSTPKIEIKAEKDGTGEENTAVTFSVRDNGIGIEKEHFDSIFQIFRRLHGPGEYGGGTGAGLAIVKKIIDEHNGKIWIESEEGKGSTFCFTVPTRRNEV